MKKTNRIIIILLLFIFIYSVPVFADTDDFYGWTWETDTDQLTVQYFASASDFSEKIMNHFADWNMIDSNVYIRSVDYVYPEEDLGKDIRIYGKELTGTTLASTGVYNKVLGIYFQVDIHSFTGAVDKAVITLDTRASGSLLSQSDARQVKTIVHEFGHTLALSHPDCGSTAIMQQGYYSPAALTIQSHDKDNLKAKW